MVKYGEMGGARFQENTEVVFPVIRNHSFTITLGSRKPQQCKPPKATVSPCFKAPKNKNIPSGNSSYLWKMDDHGPFIDELPPLPPKNGTFASLCWITREFKTFGRLSEAQQRKERLLPLLHRHKDLSAEFPGSIWEWMECRECSRSHHYCSHLDILWNLGPSTHVAGRKNAISNQQRCECYMQRLYAHWWPLHGPAFFILCWMGACVNLSVWKWQRPTSPFLNVLSCKAPVILNVLFFCGCLCLVQLQNKNSTKSYSIHVAYVCHKRQTYSHVHSSRVKPFVHCPIWSASCWNSNSMYIYIYLHIILLHPVGSQLPWALLKV